MSVLRTLTFFYCYGHEKPTSTFPDTLLLLFFFLFAPMTVMEEPTQIPKRFSAGLYVETGCLYIQYYYIQEIEVNGHSN